MSNGILDKNGNLVYDLNQRLAGDIKVEFVRASADRSETCFMCHVLTPRTLVHKLSTDKSWQVLYWCDYCFHGVQKMKSEFQGA